MDIVLGCVNVRHNQLDCLHSDLRPADWCEVCRKAAIDAGLYHPNRDANAADPEPECICHRLGPDHSIVNCPVHGRIERVGAFHVCTCGDCDSEAFADKCKFEVALRALVDNATEYHSAHVVDSELIATSKSLLESDRG